MRVWLDPESWKREVDRCRCYHAITEQNAQVAAGTIGHERKKSESNFALTINTNGRLIDERRVFSDHCENRGAWRERPLTRCCRTELGRGLLTAKSAQ